MAEQSFHRSDGKERELASRADAPTDVRCHCGSLMARVTDHGIELKCRRCKRVVLVATDRASREWVAVSLHRENRVMR